jgi:imidazolonepropionase-like amidohydrolase
MAKRERWIAGGRRAGGAEIALCVRGGRVVATDTKAPAHAERIDLRGHWLAPFAIDAHVHLAFAAGLGASDAGEGAEPGARLAALAREMLAKGIAGAIDLGAPRALMPALRSVGTPSKSVGTQTKMLGVPMSSGPSSSAAGEAAPGLPFSLAQSGPLLCAEGGYPTQSWGRDGYGLALASAGEAREAVRALRAEGATFAKLGLDGRYPVLAPEVARAVVLEAKARSMRSAAHALDVAAVRAALAAGVDVLAHTPLEPLPEALVREAGARKLAVISTLHAFGDAPAARENLARLAAAGCAPIFGTDLGNQGTSPGLSEAELRALVESGLDCADILAMCGARAASLLGDPSLGHLGVGAQAHLLVLAEDPLRDPTALCRPAQRFLAGEPLPAN